MESKLKTYSKSKYLEQLSRVNYAGERAAVLIHETQLAHSIQGKSELAAMLEQEKRHLRYFEELMFKTRAKPTLFQPLWDAATSAVAKISCHLGPDYVMELTHAVEEVVAEHYSKQIESLNKLGEKELAANIERIRAEELEHQKLAACDSNKSVTLTLFSQFIKNSCKLAIWASKRI